jgi:SNF2 family DNA or RNA helicase
MKRLWRNYSLSITLAVLFFLAWFGQLVTQWFTWANEQQEHNQPLEVGDFLWQFWTSTLENWQSEFLQLFSFVTLAALFIHKGSAESKDSDEKLEASLRRIEEHLGTLPPDAPQAPDERWQLPHTPLDVADRTG